MCENITKTNACSKSYLSPERINANSDTAFSMKSDVWCVGLTAYQMATANLPFEVSSCNYENEVRYAKVSLPGRVGSPGLRDLINECLRKVPECRPTFDDLLNTEFIKALSLLNEKSLFGIYVSKLLDSNEVISYAAKLNS